MRAPRSCIAPAVVAACLATLLATSSAWAQWIPNGVALSDTCCPGEAEVVADGNGGVFGVWRDFRTGIEEPYAQHLTGAGALAPGWSSSAFKVITGQFPGDYVDQVIPDGNGGMFISMTGGPPATLYNIILQHVFPDGTLPPGWSVSGTQVAATTNDERNSTVCRDAAGGAYVFYEVYSPRGSGTPIVRGQHTTASGAVDPSWPSAGIPVVPLANIYQDLAAAAADDSGGAIVAWADSRYQTSQFDGDIFAQRFKPDGSVAPGWPATGLPVCTAPHAQSFYNHTIVGDGAGGVFIAWTDWRNGPPNSLINSDIFMTRVRGDGTIAPGWPADGLAISTFPGSQRLYDQAADGTGGVLLAWEDDGVGAVRVQRVQGNGMLAPGWPVNGLRVGTPTDYTYEPRVCNDGAGGAYVGFTAYNTGHVYIQHLTGGGQVAAGWPADGFRASTVPGAGAQYPRICSDGAGGAILVWNEARGGPNAGSFNYAQHFAADGVVPVQLSLVSAAARDGRVQLDWFSPDGAALNASVYRRTQDSEWLALGSVSADGSGHLRYEDRAVLGGIRYGYRLGYVEQGLEHFSPETWVEVPALKLALEGLRPNPAVGELVASFSLPSAEPARLQLLDVTGRVWLAREVGSLGAGNHLVHLNGEASVPAGMYWLRLTQSGRSLLARGVVVR